MKSTQGVYIEDDTNQGRDEELELEEGSQHILRFKHIEHLIKNGTVSLI